MSESTAAMKAPAPAVPSGVLTKAEMYPPGAPHVIKAMLGVMLRVKAVEKTGFNKEQNYNYVEWAVLSAKLQDAMVQENLVLAPREISRSVLGKVLFVKFQLDAFWSDPQVPDGPGEYILNVAEGTGACRFEFRNGTTDDKAAGKAIAYGMKSLTVSLFKIPSDVDDIERDRPDPTEHTARGNGARDEPARGNGARDEPARRPTDGEEPARRPSEEPPPPSDDRYIDPRDEAPPPARDDPPYGPQGEPSPPAADPAEVDFRRSVQEFGELLNRQTSIEGARRVWTDCSDLVRQMVDATYEHFRSSYVRRWNEAPPRT